MKQQNIIEEPSREYLTKKDLEKIYGLKLSKVNNLMKTGQLGYYKILREVRFKKSDIEAFFEENKIN